jgi:hypothetical protein
MVEGFDEKLRLILEVAEALRDEFGVGIDAHPGGDRMEAGTINRAFRVMVRTIIADVVEDVDHTAIIVTSLLREAALRRLVGVKVALEQAEILVSLEPKLRDSWLAYLALAPKSVIDELIR